MSILCNRHSSYPERYLTPLCHQFTTPAHCSAATRVYTMESTRRPLKTPLNATMTPNRPELSRFRQTSPGGRRHPCQYHRINPRPSENAFSSHLDSRLPPDAQNSEISPGRRRQLCQYHRIDPSPCNNATSCRFDTRSPPVTRNSEKSPG